MHAGSDDAGVQQSERGGAIAAGEATWRPWGPWGPWRYDRKESALVHENGYWVDIADCTDAAHTLDWIYQISGKTWADDETLAGLVRALDRLANYRI